MLGAELQFHLLNTVILTAIIAPLILWRYRKQVLAGMSAAGNQALSEPLPRHRGPAAPSSPEPDAETRHFERSARLRIAGIYLVSVAVSGMILAGTCILASGVSFMPWHFATLAGIFLSAAVPMIAVSLAIPFWRAVAGWIGLMLAAALFVVLVGMGQRLSYGKPVGLDQFRLVVFFVERARDYLAVPLLLLLATGSSRLRGVAPLTLAVLLVFGIAPAAGTRLTPLLAGNATVGRWLVSTVDLFGIDVVFVLLALPAGWLAWRRLRALADGYARKRFSDAQLLARTWWLLFVTTVTVDLLMARPQPWLSAAGGGAAYLAFPMLSGWLFARFGRVANRPVPRTLLFLRVFGFRARTEHLFDRIAARWRLLGPVTMIAAPDVVARTLDPADYLNYLRGDIDDNFVRTQADLESRLALLDRVPDPDGRYRINEFCCRETTWQATVVALMEDADAVVMDLRGLTASRQGCEFELRQLGARVAPAKICLIVDQTSDRDMVGAALGDAARRVRQLAIEGNGRSRDLKTLCESLRQAAASSDLPKARAG